MVTSTQLRAISKSKTPKAALVGALVAVLDTYAPHVQAQQLAQVMHESGGLVFDREVWGPTAAQQKYEGRRDLGNTQKGDGSKYRGYGPIQLTGRANVTAFWKWCKKQGLNPPDFVEKPELIATNPWAGWSFVWYWEVGNPTGKPLTVYADQNNIEMITRRVNGGLNGYDDRLSYYDRSALVLLGYKVSELRKFQSDNNLQPDGLGGPLTRAAMHRALVALSLGEDKRAGVRASPVVETETVTQVVETAVPVTPPSADAPWWKSKEVWVPAGGFSLTGLLTAGLEKLGSIPWQNLLLVLVAVGVSVSVVMLVLKRKDAKQVKTQVAAINAVNAATVEV